MCLFFWSWELIEQVVSNFYDFDSHFLASGIEEQSGLGSQLGFIYPSLSIPRCKTYRSGWSTYGVSIPERGGPRWRVWEMGLRVLGGGVKEQRLRMHELLFFG